MDKTRTSEAANHTGMNTAYIKFDMGKVSIFSFSS
jgi:hypothetical protein